MIIFAVAAGGGISISKLFLAGVIPGVLMCLCLAVAAYVPVAQTPIPGRTFPRCGCARPSSLQTLPGLFTAVIIIGGTLSGVFTVTESGAFGAIYALLLTTLHYRSLSWQGFQDRRRLFGQDDGDGDDSDCVCEFVRLPARPLPGAEQAQRPAVGDLRQPIVVLLMINVILLLLGMIMDMAALILICTPIFLPIAKSLGMAPEHFGIMLLVNLGIGLCTPPVGTCLFIGCAVGR